MSISIDLKRSIPSARLTVSQLAGAVGVSADTVRFYEREGLLPAPERTAAGYRQYEQTSIDRMTFIQGAQRLGLALDDIRELLVVRDSGACPCVHAVDHLERRLTELDEQLARMAVLRTQMVEMITRIPEGDCPPPTPGSWCPPDCC